MKNVEEFYRNQKMPDGRVNSCKACDRIRNTIYEKKRKEKEEAMAKQICQKTGLHWKRCKCIMHDRRPGKYSGIVIGPTAEFTFEGGVCVKSAVIS